MFLESPTGNMNNLLTSCFHQYVAHVTVRSIAGGLWQRFPIISETQVFSEISEPSERKTAINPLDKSFDKFVHETLSRLHVPGVAVAVIKDGVTYIKVNETCYL